jgi:hypothetical protein
MDSLIKDDTWKIATWSQGLSWKACAKWEREKDREDRCTNKRVEINGSILGFLCWSLATSISNSSHLSNLAVLK